MATNNGFNNAISPANSPITLNAGTNAVSISTDASATTVAIANGAAVKTVTLGSTNSTSSTAIKSGTGNIALNSGLTVDSTGRATNGVQPAFQAYQSAATANTVTGDGTLYQVICNTELFDIGNNYNNATGVFTAPIAGLYLFNFAAMVQNIGSHSTLQLQINSSTQSFQGAYCSPAACKANGNFLQVNVSTIVQLAATNTVTFAVIVAGSTKTIGVNGGGPNPSQQFTYVSGYLIA